MQDVQIRILPSDNLQNERGDSSPEIEEPLEKDSSAFAPRGLVLQNENLKALKEQYQIISKIGHGSSGMVYSGIHKESQKRVAVKYLPNILSHYASLKQTVRELSILRQFSEMKENRFVIKLYDVVCPPKFEKGQDWMFLIMESAEQDLNSFLQGQLSKMKEKKKNLFVETNVIRLLYQLLCTLNFLHTASIMHRDFKPANILLLESMEVKLCDFGLARTTPKCHEGTTTPVSGDLKYEKAVDLYEHRKDRRAMKRRLSNHVVTRVYRPPEVILMEPKYCQKVDIWSLGCIVGEMLQCSFEYSKRLPSSKSRYLFYSTSCYPLSPARQRNPDLEVCVEQSDLLKTIISILGDPTNNDLSFLTSKQMKQYTRKLGTGRSKIQFSKEFHSTDEGLTRVIENCLEFNPHYRMTAEELLRLPIFDSVRDPELEKPASKRVYIDIDEEGCFDYENNKPLRWKLGDLVQRLEEEVILIQASKLDILS